ncbi:MAG: sigma-70 family RNA polymerase sigma factor [Deltaproteobacteria bacterium]|nr:sigma-70 family RNA polymerase sigma factor [Deltaproteobacteria bacterium]
MSTRARGGAGPAEEPEAGAGAHPPADNAAKAAPPKRTRRVSKKAPAPAAAAPTEAPTEEPEEESPSEPEVLWDKDQIEPEVEPVDDAGSEGPVVDVGTMPTLPSLVSMPASTASSVPALRSKDGARQPLDAFLAEVGRYPLLTLDEEKALTMAYYEHQDPIAAKKLVVHNLRLVVKMAYKYRRAWASVLDLIQEGNVGLVEAVQRFDPFKGAKFSTYATFWIRAYMLRYLLEHSRTVRISRTRVGRKLFFQLARERAKLRAQGVEPGPRLLAERLGVKQEDLEEVVRHMDQSEVRLDAPVHLDDQSAGTILDGMSGSGATPEAEAFRKEFEASVGDALEAFAETLTDAREKAAWDEHLMAEDPISLSDLGARFGVTKQRMGQIVTGLRKRLKEHLIQTLGPDVELGYHFDVE